MAILLAILVFVGSVLLGLGIYVLLTRLPAMMLRRRITERVESVHATDDGESDSASTGVVKARAEGPLPMLDRLADRTAKGVQFSRWIQQAGIRSSVSMVVLVVVGSMVSLALIGAAVLPAAWGLLAGAAVGFILPVVVLRYRRTGRLRRFEEHFPEGLDLIARAIRAGHGFTTGLKMVADEADDPVGPEFRTTFDEQNFGLPLKDALNNLADRVPLLDVRFFATAVLIQRETGGNLSEILDNLSHVVRERFKIQRQVRVYTAHGRFTGYVLLGLPAVLSVALSFINPEHMNMLFHEPMGQAMIGGAVVMQVVGYLWIKKIVKIEV